MKGLLTERLILLRDDRFLIKFIIKSRFTNTILHFTIKKAGILIKYIRHENYERFVVHMSDCVNKFLNLYLHVV